MREEPSNLKKMFSSFVLFVCFVVTYLSAASLTGAMSHIVS